MFSSALRRNACNRAFYYFKKSLLYAFAGNVARDGHVFGLSCDFVYFVYINYTLLRAFDIVIRRLNEFEKDILYVLADVARFRKSGCVRNCERHVQNTRKSSREQGFAATGRT